MFNRVQGKPGAILLALAGYTAFSGADIFAKILTRDYAPVQIVAIDTFFAALILLAFAPVLGGLRSLRDRKNSKIHALRALLNTIVNVVIVYCFSIMPIATVYTAVFLKPIMAAVIAIFLYREKVTANRWLAIVAGFAGILLALQPWESTMSAQNILLLLGLTFTIALMFVIMRSAREASPLATGFYPILGACVLSSVMSAGQFVMPAAADLPLFFMAGAASAAGIVCVSMAFQKADSAVVSPMLYSEMIWGVLFGYLLFSDVPGFWMLAGTAVIIASGFHLITTERRIAPAPEIP